MSFLLRGYLYSKLAFVGGKSSVLWSAISFDGDALAESQNAICDHKTDHLPPQRSIFNTVNPTFMHFFTSNEKRRSLMT